MCTHALEREAVRKIVEQRPLDGVRDGVARVAEGCRRLTREFARELMGPGKQRIRGKHLADHAEFERLLGVDALPGQQEIPPTAG